MQSSSLGLGDNTSVKLKTRSSSWYNLFSFFLVHLLAVFIHCFSVIHVQENMEGYPGSSCSENSVGK